MEKEFEYILSNIHNDIPKNIAQKIKHYIYNNRDNEEVKIFLYKLILEYKKYFDSNEVINALNISEQFTYLKRQEVSKIIPSSNLTNIVRLTIPACKISFTHVVLISSYSTSGVKTILSGRNHFKKVNCQTNLGCL